MNSTQILQSQIFQRLERIIGTMDDDFLNNIVTVMWMERTFNGRCAATYCKISSSEGSVKATIQMLIAEKSSIYELIQFCYAKQLKAVSRLKKLNK